jgi:hypothetical protein
VPFGFAGKEGNDGAGNQGTQQGRADQPAPAQLGQRSRSSCEEQILDPLDGFDEKYAA